MGRGGAGAGVRTGASRTGSGSTGVGDIYNTIGFFSQSAFENRKL